MENRKKTKKKSDTFKNKLSIGTWNVRTLNGNFKTDNLLQEITRMKLNILGVAETHCTNEIGQK